MLKNTSRLTTSRFLELKYKNCFGLENYFYGVNIYRQRPDETDFSYLATDTHSPYVDNEPMVNGTQYCAYFIIGDTEVGKRSAIVKISI